MPLGKVTLILDRSKRFKMKFNHLTENCKNIPETFIDYRILELFKKKGHQIQVSEINHG